MQQIKDQEQVVRTNISVRRRALFQLDEVGSLIKWRTGFGVSRSKLIEITAYLLYEIRDEIDYDHIRDEATLQRELGQALVRMWGRGQEPPAQEE